MEQIEAFTGQREALSALRRWLNETGKSSHYQVLEGLSGTGKTWVARQISAYANDKFAVLTLNGDSSGLRLALAPFWPVFRTSRADDDVKDAISELSSFAPLGGDALKWAIQYAMTHREVSRERQIGFLRDSRRDIVCLLEKIAAKKPLILILDDLHAWDEMSLELLYMLQTEYFNTTYKFLAQARYLAIVTSDQEPLATTEFEAVISRFTEDPIRLSFCKEQELSTVLRGFGLRAKLPDTTVHELYRVTHGHLAALERIPEFIEGMVDTSTMVEQSTFHKLCLDMLTAWIARCSDSKALTSLLRFAATIGVTFTADEIKCLSDSDLGAVSALLKEATDLQIIRKLDNGTRFEFAHHIFREVLSDELGGRKQELHLMFAHCLGLVRPGDYATRARHYLLGDDHEKARVMQGHEVLAALRARRTSIEEALTRVADLSELARPLRQIVLATQAYNDGHCRVAIRYLSNIDPATPRSIIAESEIILAQSRVKILETDEQRAATKNLELFDDLEIDEREVWERLAFARVIALAFAGATEKARTTAPLLMKALKKNGKLDLDTRRTLYRLRARADIYLTPEAAEGSLREAVAYFGADPDSRSRVRDPLNYFLALNNYVGNALMRGDMVAASRAVSLVHSFLRSIAGTADEITLPRFDMFLSNAAIVDFYSGVISAAEAVKALAAATETGPSGTDRPLLVSNLAGFFIEAGRFGDAMERLAPVYDLLAMPPAKDPYYVYYVGNNYAMSQLGLGRVTEARKIWESLPSPAGVAPANSELLLHRHQVISKALEANKPSLRVCQDRLEASLPADPEAAKSWKHYGRSVLLSELQFWMDE